MGNKQNCEILMFGCEEEEQIEELLREGESRWFKHKSQESISGEGTRCNRELEEGG